MQFFQELDGSIRAVDLTELLQYYIADKLQTVLCEVDDRMNDCPLTIIFSGSGQDRTNSGQGMVQIGCTLHLLFVDLAILLG
ncbi:hypothetical protein T05_7206, partial [Trichinella murrelli]